MKYTLSKIAQAVIVAALVLGSLILIGGCIGPYDEQPVHGTYVVNGQSIWTLTEDGKMTEYILTNPDVGGCGTWVFFAGDFVLTRGLTQETIVGTLYWAEYGWNLIELNEDGTIHRYFEMERQ